MGPDGSFKRQAGPYFSRRLTMRFKKGVHYVIDRPMIEMMMRHGMFQEAEDELTKEGHGPLFIKDFEVYSDSEGKVGALDDSKQRARERPWYLRYAQFAHSIKAAHAQGGFGLTMLAGVAALAASISLVVMRSKM